MLLLLHTKNLQAVQEKNSKHTEKQTNGQTDRGYFTRLLWSNITQEIEFQTLSNRQTLEACFP